MCILGGGDLRDHLGTLPLTVCGIPMSLMWKRRLRGIIQFAQGHSRTAGIQDQTRHASGARLFPLPLPHPPRPSPEGADLAVCCRWRSADRRTRPRLCPPASRAATCIRRPEGKWTSASAFKWSRSGITSGTWAEGTARNVPDLLKQGQLGQVSSQLRDINAVILTQDQTYSPLNVSQLDCQQVLYYLEESAELAEGRG